MMPLSGPGPTADVRARTVGRKAQAEAGRVVGHVSSRLNFRSLLRNVVCNIACFIVHLVRFSPAKMRFRYAVGTARAVVGREHTQGVVFALRLTALCLSEATGPLALPPAARAL